MYYVSFSISILQTLLLSAFISAVGIETGQGTEQAPFRLADPKEQAAWAKIAARFEDGPEIRRDREKRITAVRMKGCRQKPRGKGWVEIQLDPENGSVRKLASDASFSNAQLRELSAFSRMHELTLWHNNPPTKEQKADDYDGSGLRDLRKLPELREVTMAGGTFDDDGMAAAAQLPHLEYLGVWNTQVTDIGLAAFREHPRLKRIRLGANWHQRITDAGMVALAEVPNLEAVVIGETWLTYQGLASFIALNGELKVLDLGNSLIEPGGIQRLRNEMPDTRIKWKGLEATGELLSANEWARNQLMQWAPKKLVAQALKMANQREIADGR